MTADPKTLLCYHLTDVFHPKSFWFQKACEQPTFPMPPSPLAGLETLADVSNAVVLAQGLRQRGQTFSTPREGSAVASREVYFFASLHCFASMR